MPNVLLLYQKTDTVSSIFWMIMPDLAKLGQHDLALEVFRQDRGPTIRSKLLVAFALFGGPDQQGVMKTAVPLEGQGAVGPAPEDQGSSTVGVVLGMQYAPDLVVAAWLVAVAQSEYLHVRPRSFLGTRPAVCDYSNHISA